jgi:16S rRNA (guanine(1405)-N(7))-methyltransferase
MEQQDDPVPIDALVAVVRQSAGYRTVHPAFITRIGRAELGKRRSFKDAVKATKNKLHQVGGVYFDANPSYGRWLDNLHAARKVDDEEGYRNTCREIMRHQSSTRERLPILAELYARALEPIRPVRSVIDIACGLNPLSIPWMPLEPETEYWAYDVYEDLIAFLGEAIPLSRSARGSGVIAHVSCEDVTRQDDPVQLASTRTGSSGTGSSCCGPVDVALILKAVPCLDQVDRSAAARLLEVIDARHFLISFPVRTLGGRNKGMATTYQARVDKLLAGANWNVQRIELATELVFLVSRAAG